MPLHNRAQSLLRNAPDFNRRVQAASRNQFIVRTPCNRDQRRRLGIPALQASIFRSCFCINKRQGLPIGGNQSELGTGGIKAAIVDGVPQAKPPKLFAIHHVPENYSCFRIFVCDQATVWMMRDSRIEVLGVNIRRMNDLVSRGVIANHPIWQLTSKVCNNQKSIVNRIIYECIVARKAGARYTPNTTPIFV